MSRSCLPTRGGNSTRLYYSCTSGQRRTRPCDMPRVGQGGLLARCTPRLLIGGVRQVRMGYTIEDIPIPTADASRRFKDRHECTNKSRSTIRPRPNKLPMHWPWRTHKNPPTIWARPKKTCHRFGPGPKKPANELAPAKKNANDFATAQPDRCPSTAYSPKKPASAGCAASTSFRWWVLGKTRQRMRCKTKTRQRCRSCPPAILLVGFCFQSHLLVGSWKNPPTIWPWVRGSFVGWFFVETLGLGEITRQRFGPGQKKPADDLALAKKNPPTIWHWPQKTRQRFGPGPCPTKPATDLALAQQKPANDLAPVKRHPTIGPRPTNNANELARQKQHHRFGPGQQPANDLVPASRAPAIWRRFGPGRQTTANSAKQNPRRFGPWCSIQYIVCNMYT